MSVVATKKADDKYKARAVSTSVFGSLFWPTTIVVVVAGAAAAASLAAAPNPQGTLGALLAIIVVLIAFFDWRSFIIPNWLNAGGFFLGLVHVAILTPGDIRWTFEAAIVRGLVAALVFFALRFFYSALRGRQGLGLGDVKLAAVAGVWLDWSTLPIAIELAAATALCGYVLRQLILGHRVLAQNRVPFGFFFAPAIWICWFCQNSFFIDRLGR
jgi:leader peptidase (prepilin peptidase) / N-methyltransferase